MFSFVALILLGGGVAFMEVRRPQNASPAELRSGKELTLVDLAVPKPLLDEVLASEGPAEPEVLADHPAFLEFLRRHDLADGVLIGRICSSDGDLLYIKYAPLADPETFRLYIPFLPRLLRGGDGGRGPLLPKIHGIPSEGLRDRAAAEAVLETGIFPPITPLDLLRGPH